MFPFYHLCDVYSLMQEEIFAMILRNGFFFRMNEIFAEENVLDIVLSEVDTI